MVLKVTVPALSTCARATTAAIFSASSSTPLAVVRFEGTPYRNWSRAERHDIHCYRYSVTETAHDCTLRGFLFGGSRRTGALEARTCVYTYSRGATKDVQRDSWATFTSEARSRGMA